MQEKKNVVKLENEDSDLLDSLISKTKKSTPKPKLSTPPSKRALKPSGGVSMSLFSEPVKKMKVEEPLIDIKREVITPEELDEFNYDDIPMEEEPSKQDATVKANEIQQTTLEDNFDFDEIPSDFGFQQQFTIQSSQLPESESNLLTSEPMDQDSFRMFWIDAYDKGDGTVFLFGKTKSEKKGTYSSCCLTVRNLQRNVYILPKKEYCKNALFF
jgi:DNA polymerase alpha subunit A